MSSSRPLDPVAVSTDYDVIVSGGGSPGEDCVGELVKGGLRVALVERELWGASARTMPALLEDAAAPG
jgi:ribulose 1,5-bisphosphate synthetase/thiazole synthase